MCDTVRRHKSRHGRYDINGFITQLLASRRFDELAEKLAEKAANKIMIMKADQTHVDRAIDNNDTEIAESTKRNTQDQSDELNERKRVQLTKSFAGKIDPEAVMNETILLTESLKLKYKYLKNNADKKIQLQREMASRNVTQEDLSKQNRTMTHADGEHTGGNETEVHTIAKGNATQQIHNDVTTEPIDVNKSKSDDTKDDVQKQYPVMNTEGITFHSGPDAEQKESSQINDQKEPNLLQEPINLPVETNTEVEIKEQEPNPVENVIKEDNLSSLDEQNLRYVPSAEKTSNIFRAEMDKYDEEIPRYATRESGEFGNAVAYFRGRGDDVEENKVPSESDQPSPYSGIDKSVASNENGNRGSEQQAPEEEGSRENAEEEPATPVVRKEGGKVYTYVQDPEYKDYHEELAKWQKEHPDNPADFL